MSSTRMLEIAIELGKLYREKAELSIKEWQTNQDADARRIELTPETGWPGKNEGERRAAMEKAFSADAVLKDLLGIAEDCHKEIELVASDIAALEAERRGLEWSIRSQLVTHLSLAGVQANHNGPIAETAFDDTADHRVDQAAFAPAVPSAAAELDF